MITNYSQMSWQFLSGHHFKLGAPPICEAKKHFKQIMLAFFMLFFLVPNSIFAQSSANYTFVTDTSGSLSDMAGSSQLIGPGLDANASAVTNIGFEFFFMGNRFTQFSVQEDGILQLGTTAAGTNVYTLTGGTATSPRLSAFVADLRTGATSGKIHYKVSGAAPNRVLTVEFLNMQLFYTGAAAPGTSTWQMRLFENGNIEYVYGAMSATDISSTNRLPSVGFYTGVAAGSFVAVNYSTHTASTATYAQNAIVSATGMITELNSTADGSRRVYQFTPPGNAGNAVATALAPPTSLTFSGVSPLSTALNWIPSAPISGVLKYLIYSSLDGINYTYLNSVNVGTNTYAVTGLVPNTNYTFKVFAISEGGKSTDLVGAQTTSVAGSVNAIASGNWSDVATWSSGVVPTAGDNVTIPAGFTVTEDVTAATAYELTISGNLVYTATTARTLTVGGNVTINPGGTFKSAASGTVTTHSLAVGGNLVNNGTLDFNAFSTSGANITFNTANTANFTLGAASVTNLRTVTLNKGTSVANTLTFTSGGVLTVQGANTAGFLVITSGLFKMDGTATFSNPLFATAGYTIGANGGLWLNNPNATILAQTGSPTFAGLFRISAGTFNIGTATGNSVGFSAGSTTIIEGGAINAASRFGVGTATNAINYTQTGGILTLNMIGNASTTLASWDLGTAAASVVNISGGTVYIQNASTAATGPRDVRGTTSVVPVFTGGTLQIGNAATAANFVFRAQGQIPANVVIDNTTNPKTLQLVVATTSTIYGNLTIEAGSTFDSNGFTAQILGASVVNNGSILGTVAGSRFDFVGSIPQTYSGTGTFGTNTVAFQGTGVGISNANNVTLNAPIIATRFNLFAGTFINSNLITVGNATASAAVQRGGASGVAGSFDVTPNFNLLTSQISLLYNASTVAITTGVEVPAARLASFVSINNATGVVLAGGNLETAALTLTLGNVTTSPANVLSLSGTLAASLAGGSATSYINGPFMRTIATGNANNSYILYPVGKASYAPISIAPATTSVAVFKAEAFDANAGTEDPSIIGLNQTRRWEVPLVSGTITDLNVKIGDAGIVSSNIPVHSATAAGAYAATFGSTGTYVAGTPNTLQSISPMSAGNYVGFIGYATSNACTGTPAPGNTVASSLTICLGGSVTLSLQNVTAGSGVTYVWESSADGTTFAPIAGATASTYAATPATALYYRASVTCGGNTGVSAPVQITFTNNILTTAPATRCGIGTVSLAATATTGTVINWYAQAAGGNPVATGSSFVTPSISATTSYWAEAQTSGSTLAGGIIAPPSSWTGSTFLDWGIIFNTLTAVTVNSVDLYSTAAGTVNLKIVNAAGTELYSTGNVTVANGGVTTPNVVPINFYLPVGENYKILVKSYTGVNLVRGSTSLAFPYTNGHISVTASENGGTTTASYYYMHNIKTTGFCSSPRTQVVATVTAPPALTLSGNPAAICSGQSSTLVTVTSGASDFDTYVWSPSTGVSGDAATGWIFNPAITTSYTLTASQSTGSLCNTTASVVVSVNALPIPAIISPSPASVCENTILPLVVTGGTIGIAGKIGSGTATNGLSTPFKANWGGSKTQALYTAAELTALGIQPGQKVNSIGFVSLSGTPSAFNNFTISAGFVSAPVLGAAFIPGANTVVYAPATYTPATGTGNLDFSLATPLVWDGISNLLVETCFNNNTSGSGSAAVLSVQSSTVASGLNLYRSQDLTADVCSNATAPGTTANRPNLRISTLETTSFTWSPAANLYSDAAATTPYVAGTNASTVYFKSSTAAPAATYTATATSVASCSVSASVNVTVNAIVAPDFAAIPAFCSGTAAPALATTSPNGITGSWSPATVSNTASGTYVFTPTAGQCATPQTLAVTVTPSIVPDFAAIPAFCSGATAPTLAAASPNGITGTWSPATVSNTASGTYVFTPSAGQCATTQTLSVTVTVTAAPTGTSPQDYTTGNTLADFVIAGTGIIWYDAPTGGNVLPSTTVLVSGVTYYASQTVSGCESPTRLPITAGNNLKVDGFGFKSLKYYPNPVNNVLTVSYSEEITGLKLYNMVGQELMNKKVSATETQLDMSHLPAGSYLLEVSSGAQSKMVKLLKNQ